MKKLLAALTAAVTLSNCFPMGVSAEGGIVISLEYPTRELLRSGDTVKVDVKISDNTGLSSWRVCIDYDSSAFEYIDFTAGVFGEDTFASRVEYKANPFVIAFSNLDEETDIAENGVIGTVTFKVKDGFEGANDYSFGVSYNSKDFYNSTQQPVAVCKTEIPAETLRVYPGTEQLALKGDLNGDGEINADDKTLFSKYLVGEKGIELNEAAADLDGDGKASAGDYALLAKYISGWKGFEKYIVPLT